MGRLNEGGGNCRGEFKLWGSGSSAGVGFVSEGYLGGRGFRLGGFEEIGDFGKKGV